MRITSFSARLWLGLSFCWLLSVSPQLANAQAWLWAARPLGTGNAMFRGSTVDAAGNTYVVGNYTGTITCGTQTLTTPGDWDLFVGKISASGQWQWVKRAGRAGSTDIGYCITVDRTGNVFVGGQLSAGTYTFDALTPLVIQSVGCASYGFLGKLSAAGQWQWVKGATGGSFVVDIVADPTGNVCAVGTTRSANPFTPTVPPFGDYAYATKFSTTGTLLWNTSALVNGGNDDVAVDAAGNFYLGGHFKNTVTIGTTSLPSLGRTDGFIAKLSAAGQWQWAQRIGSIGEDALTDVAVDATGNVYATASLNGRATIGTTVFEATTNAYGIVAKYTPAGQSLWAVRPAPTTATDSQWPTAVTIDAGGSLHILGYNRGSNRFGTTTVTTSAYVARLNATTGAWQWAQGVPMSDGYGAQSVCSGPAGALWMSGYYLSSLQLGTLALAGGTNYSGVMAKMTFAAPTLSSLTPASGAVGSTVTLNGTNLQSVTSVKFGTRVAAYTVVSATRLTVTVPAGATTGVISVTTTGGTVNSPTVYSIVAPTLTSFSPTTGPVGTLVTINGSGFTGTTGVRFNATAALTFTVVSATRITAVVPVGATTGVISVLTPGGTKQFATSFTVTARRDAPAVVATPAPIVVPAEAISFYPNPARVNETVLLTVPASNQQVDLLDANGIAVRSQALKADATQATVSLAGLRPGFYTVRCGRVMRRLLVE
jgi:Beta-propeller repeat